MIPVVTAIFLNTHIIVMLGWQRVLTIFLFGSRREFQKERDKGGQQKEGTWSINDDNVSVYPFWKYLVVWELKVWQECLKIKYDTILLLER